MQNSEKWYQTGLWKVFPSEVWQIVPLIVKPEKFQMEHFCLFVIDFFLLIIYHKLNWYIFTGHANINVYLYLTCGNWKVTICCASGNVNIEQTLVVCRTWGGEEESQFWWQFQYLLIDWLINYCVCVIKPGSLTLCIAGGYMACIFNARYGSVYTNGCYFAWVVIWKKNWETRIWSCFHLKLCEYAI